MFMCTSAHASRAIAAKLDSVKETRERKLNVFANLNAYEFDGHVTNGRMQVFFGYHAWTTSQTTDTAVALFLPSSSVYTLQQQCLQNTNLKLWQILNAVLIHGVNWVHNIAFVQQSFMIREASAPPCEGAGMKYSF